MYTSVRVSRVCIVGDACGGDVGGGGRACVRVRSAAAYQPSPSLHPFNRCVCTHSTAVCAPSVYPFSQCAPIRPVCTHSPCSRHRCTCVLCACGLMCVCVLLTHPLLDWLNRVCCSTNDTVVVVSSLNCVLSLSFSCDWCF